MRNRYFTALIIACAFALAAVCSSVSAQKLRQDVDYRLIPQQPVASGQRVEVLEFFFYACPYCNQLEPLIAHWDQTKPADVTFKRVPVVRHDSWGPLAKIYFTLETLGLVDKLQSAVYHGYHIEGLRLNQEQVIADWAAKQGLDADKFMAIYHSKDVQSKVDHAMEMTLAYDIEATPSVVVDGRYLTSSGMTDGVGGVIPVLDDMVRMAREQRAAGKTAQ